MRHYCFYVYILTNPGKTTLYIGFTNNLTRRLKEHRENKKGTKTFTGRYCCHKLIYFETFQYVNNAIAREKQLKRWSRMKKEKLISVKNPTWKFLNEEFY